MENTGNSGSKALTGLVNIEEITDKGERK